MNPIILRAWNALTEWCDGGPSPDKETLREAFMLLVQGQAPEPAQGPDAELAANVIPFCPTSKVTP